MKTKQMKKGKAISFVLSIARESAASLGVWSETQRKAEDF